MSDLTITALCAMAESLRPKATTPLDEALGMRPVLLLESDVEGLVAARVAPGQAVLLTRDPAALADKLRKEGLAVATGDDARALAFDIAGGAALASWIGVGLAGEARYELEQTRRIEEAKLLLEALRHAVGAEQVERALWWAGPIVVRLEAARGYLAEGRTVDENGEWPQRPYQPGVIRELSRHFLFKQFAQRDDRWRVR